MQSWHRKSNLVLLLASSSKASFFKNMQISLNQIKIWQCHAVGVFWELLLSSNTNITTLVLHSVLYREMWVLKGHILFVITFNIGPEGKVLFWVATKQLDKRAFGFYFVTVWYLVKSEIWFLLPNSDCSGSSNINIKFNLKLKIMSQEV